MNAKYPFHRVKLLAFPKKLLAFPKKYPFHRVKLLAFPKKEKAYTLYRKLKSTVINIKERWEH